MWRRHEQCGRRLPLIEAQTPGDRRQPVLVTPDEAILAYPVRTLW